MQQGSAVAKFHEERRLPDVYLQTAAEAATFFTAAEIEGHTFFKIGYCFEEGQGFIAVLKYAGERKSGEAPRQKIMMQTDALAHMVSTLSKATSPKAADLLFQMSEGLRMAETFDAQTTKLIAKPKGLVAA